MGNKLILVAAFFVSLVCVKYNGKK